MRASRENAKPTLLRRALACLVSAAMVVAFTPVVAWGATASGVSYVNAAGETQPSVSATVVESGDTSWGSDGNNGWYVVSGTVEIGNRITVSGSVNLILADGCTLTVNGGIEVQDDDSNLNNGSTNSLTIYAQSTGGSMGSLTAQNVADFNAGIGGGGDGNGGTITINGGTVTANGGTGGAGIGGGLNGSGGSITITGGVVNASDNESGAAIGGGGRGSGGTITINGGVVNAISAKVGGAGIGSGNGSSSKPVSSGNITINGGVVTAAGSGRCSGIGYDESWNNGTNGSSFRTGEMATRWCSPARLATRAAKRKTQRTRGAA